MVASSSQVSMVAERVVDPVPLRIVAIELGKPLPVITTRDEQTGQEYVGARCLVCLHGHALGIVDFSFEGDTLEPREYAQCLWDRLNGAIAEHLTHDGLAVPDGFGLQGLVCAQTPLCVQKTEAFAAVAPFVSVIVSTHNRTEELAQCIPALLAQQYPRYEVVIVDNAPSDSGTFDLLQQRYGDVPNLRYVCEERPGLSRGLNRGIAVAEGGILAFTDDDVVVDAQWLLQLVKAFTVADDVVCATGLIVPRELETLAQILFEEYGGFSKGFKRCIYDMAEHRPQEPLFPYTAGRFGSGASMAFKADFLRSVGGFDIALTCGMDIAAFFQAIKQGHTLVYEPAALAYHCHRRSYNELRKQIYSYGVGLAAYLTKNILDHPRVFFELLIKIPYGIFFTLSARSPKNRKKLVHYPRELTWLEIKGMLRGPLVYLRARRAFAEQSSPFREGFHDEGALLPLV